MAKSARSSEYGPVPVTETSPRQARAARLPLSTVGAVEFLGTVLLAVAGARTRRNLLALTLAVGGVALLTNIRLAGEPAGFAFAFANCALFMLYVVLGHRIANEGTADPA